MTKAMGEVEVAIRSVQHFVGLLQSRGATLRAAIMSLSMLTDLTGELGPFAILAVNFETFQYQQPAGQKPFFLCPKTLSV